MVKEQRNNLPSRAQQMEVVKIIGTRMKEARELCGLSLTTAALRLGYRNPSKLSKIENATDTANVPVWTINRAAMLYEVSVDYLFGASDDWEVGARATQERGTSQWLFSAWEQARIRDMETLKRLHDKVQAMSETIGAMLNAAEATKSAMDRFIELNDEFQDMRAGSRLMAAVDQGVVAARGAQIKMNRFRIDCSVAAKSDGAQLVLFVLED